MFVLFKDNNKYRGAFICDICKDPIVNVEDANAIIAGQGSKFYPRTHVHTECFTEDLIDKNRDVVMSLIDLIKVMIE